MRVAAASVALVTLLVAAAAGARADTVAYAIVIGNNAAPEGTELAPLRYADDDALRYHRLFSRFATAHLLTVLDAATQRRYPGAAAATRPPTLANLRRTVADLRARMIADRARGDEPVFYLVFSGHGARTGNGDAYLALVGGALGQEILYDEILAALPSRYSHVIVDACHAGGVIGLRGGFFDRELEAETAPVAAADVMGLLRSEQLSRFPHVGVLVATTLGQEAHEWSEIEAGVFSHELLSGLLGPADVNGDLQVEYSEISAFVAAANRALEDPRAAAQVIARPPASNRNAALVSLAGLRGVRLLRGDPSAWGHFHVELGDGQRYLDAHLAAGSDATIALPATGEVFVRSGTREARVPAGSVIATAALRWQPREVSGRGSIDSAYQRGLFASPYGPHYYRGHVDSTGGVGVAFSRPDAQRGGERPGGGERSRGPAIGALAVAGVSAAASLTTAALALDARRDYHATDLQRPAHEARQRFERHRNLAIATGTVAIAAGAVAYWLWPDADPRVAPALSADGAYSLAVVGRW